MFATVQIHITDEHETNTREKFWSAFFRSKPSDAKTPEYWELLLKNKFAPALETRMNAAYSSPGSGINALRRLQALAYAGGVTQPFQIELVEIRYGSVDLLLNILGVDQKTLAEGFLNLLAFYSPLVFNEVLQTDVPMTARIEMNAPLPLSPNNTSKPWALMQTSLLVPVLLALGVTYFAFEGMRDRLKAIDEERNALRQEHTKLLTAVVDQNGKLASAVLARVADAKSRDDFQQSIMKQVLSRPSSAPNTPSKGAAGVD